MTEEEKSGIVHEVIETIKGQSQDIAELPVSDNIEDFTTLPAVGRDGRLKKFRVTDLRSEFAGGSNIESLCMVTPLPIPRIYFAISSLSALS